MSWNVSIKSMRARWSRHQNATCSFRLTELGEKLGIVFFKINLNGGIGLSFEEIWHDIIDTEFDNKYFDFVIHFCLPSCDPSDFFLIIDHCFIVMISWMHHNIETIFLPLFNNEVFGCNTYILYMSYSCTCVVYCSWPILVLPGWRGVRCVPICHLYVGPSCRKGSKITTLQYFLYS